MEITLTPGDRCYKVALRTNYIKSVQFQIIKKEKIVTVTM